MKNTHKNKTIARFIRIIAATMVLMLMLGSALASYQATVNTSSMNVYSKSSASSKKLGALKAGTEVTILSYTSTWAKISYKGYTGYSQLKNLRLKNRIKGYTSKVAPLYKTASASGKKLGTVASGTEVYVAGRNGSYYLVENRAGTVSGYIHSNYLTKNKPEIKGSYNSTYAAQVVKLVNEVRSSYGLTLLTIDNDLTEAAKIRAKEIVTNFSHTRPNGTTWDTVSSKAYGENLGKGYNSNPERIVDAWMDSTGHRANILREDYTSIGVVAYNVEGTVYWVQLFGID